MLNNIKTKQKGFTIVELLIVIVIIAILAAITIVAYNGITNRAKASAGQSLSNSIIKKSQAYYAAGSTNAYPAAIANFADTNESKIDNTAQVVAYTAGTGSGGVGNVATYNNGNIVVYRPVTVSSTNDGACVFWWDYTKGTAQQTPALVGTATAANCAA